MVFDVGWFAGLLSSWYGLFGLFLAAMIGNATILFPAPVDFLVLVAGALISDPYFLVLAVLAASLGAALGEMSAYFLGFFGINGIKKMGEHRVDKILEIGENLATAGVPIIFFGALTPFPFDLIGIAAGLIHYNPKKFFAAAFAGKAVRYLLIGLAGFLGYGAVEAAVKTWFMI
jgi:membrane protein YqaA with SNARE-associated domain